MMHRLPRSLSRTLAGLWRHRRLIPVDMPSWCSPESSTSSPGNEQRSHDPDASSSSTPACRETPDRSVLPGEQDDPIGVVGFRTHRGEPAEAILDQEGRWCCPQLPVLDRVLNILFDPHRQSAEDEPLGHAELQRVAAWLKGTVQVGTARSCPRESSGCSRRPG